MRFERQPRRHEAGFAWTPRKLAAAASRGERVQLRERRRYPLLADQAQAPAPFDAAAEAQLRDAAARASQQAHRDFDARVWRESRRDARAATPEQQRAIREAWNRWRGPCTALYFRCVVDEHTGAFERRLQAMQAERAALIRQIEAGAQAQGELHW